MAELILNKQDIAVLKDRRFRERVSKLSRHFPTIDRCLALVGEKCERLPSIYQILVGEVTKTSQGYKWFVKAYPKAKSLRKAPPQSQSPPQPTPLVVVAQGKKKNPTSKALAPVNRMIESIDKKITIGRRGNAVERAIRMIKSYGDKT